MRRILFFTFFVCLCSYSSVLAKTAVSSSTVSFNPTIVAVAPKGGFPVGTVVVWPSNSNPSDAEKWLECDGRAVSSSLYPKLYAMMHTTPNLRGQFIRGLQSGHSVLEKVNESIITHTSSIAPHSHTIDGKLINTEIQGTALGQQFSTNANFTVSGKATGQTLSSKVNLELKGVKTPKITKSGSGSDDITVSYRDIGATSNRHSEGNFKWSYHGSYVKSSGSQTINVSATNKITGTIPEVKVTGNTKGTVSGTASSSSLSNAKATGSISGTMEESVVTGNLSSGSVKGTALDSGELTAYYDGQSETAPKHIYVRYLIRAAD